jgi:hypothetical protein
VFFDHKSSEGFERLDAKQYIQHVALPNYETFEADPNNYSKLHNAIGAFNAVPEHVAHARHGYAEKLPRSVIRSESEKVRQQYPEFGLIKDSAEALKHVRLAKWNGDVIQSSTGISPSERQRGFWIMARQSSI